MSVMFKPCHRLRAIAAAIAVIASTGIAAALAAGVGAGIASAQSATEYQKPSAAPAAQPRSGDREVFIATVHLDGNGNAKGDAKHPPEAFPTDAMPAGGGLLLTPPAEDGAWRMRAFLFEPRQVIAFQGAPLTLHFVGVQGPSHRIQIDCVAEIIELKRGQVKTVTVAADTPGVIGYRSLDRLPSMQGSIVVLPRP